MVCTMERAHLLALLFCTSAAKLIGFGEVSSSSRSVASSGFVTSLVELRATQKSVGDSQADYGVVSMDENGTYESITSPPVRFAKSTLCDAAYDIDAGVYYKTFHEAVTFSPSSGCEAIGGCSNTSLCCQDPTAPNPKAGQCYKVTDCSALVSTEFGYILTIDANSGKVIGNVTMSSPDLPTFSALDAVNKVLYSMQPYSYTNYTLVSYDITTGQQTQLHTFPKAQFDGIALCKGSVLSTTGELVYAMGGQQGQELKVLNLKTMNFTATLQGDFTAFIEDPSKPGMLLTLRNLDYGVQVLRFDLKSGKQTELLTVNKTSLGQKLRAPEDASLTMQSDGMRGWFIASYNTRDGSLMQGIFTFEMAGDSATLVHEQYACGRNITTHNSTNPLLGSLNWHSDGARTQTDFVV